MYGRYSMVPTRRMHFLYSVASISWWILGITWILEAVSILGITWSLEAVCILCITRSLEGVGITRSLGVCILGIRQLDGVVFVLVQVQVVLVYLYLVPARCVVIFGA